MPTSVLKSASEGAYAFVSLDVDKFKVINDQFGLEQGDAVLKVLYDSIAGQLDAGEFVGRISADLFNLLLKTNASQRLEARLEEMIAEANRALVFDGVNTYLLTATAGVYVVDDPALPMIRIRDRANVARKKAGARRAGRLCSCRLYSNEDCVRLANEKDIENRMARSARGGRVRRAPSAEARSAQRQGGGRRGTRAMAGSFEGPCTAKRLHPALRAQRIRR